MSKEAAIMTALGVGLLASTAAGQDQAERDRRMAWFREARFGMFIHWGLYAVPAGTWKGEQIPGIGEWIMNRARIPVAEYEQLTKQFNPVKFNAREWAKVARDAGQRYMIITAKHHDGFAMFNSTQTGYDIVESTPYGKDPMKDLAEACAEVGIRFGFYYSQMLDWHDPNARGNNWDYPSEGEKDFQKYLDEVVKPHLRDLLTNYGPICMIWFDIGTPTAEQAQQLKDLVRELQPDTLVSGRIGHGLGDFQEMGDNQIPGARIQGDWQTPATINDTWGFKSYDQNWKSPEVLIHNLVDIVSKGGNYLLNVGPTAEGIIPQPSVERLKAVGDWLQVNGDSIYGANMGPFRRLPWGRCTAKPGKLYLHVFDWPEGELEVPGLTNEVQKAYLLANADQGPLKVTRSETGIQVEVPGEAPDAIDTVVVLEIEGEPEVEEFISQSPDGTVSLRAVDADVHGNTARYESGGGKDNIGYWTDTSDWVSWDVRVTKPGTFGATITYACDRGSGGSTYRVNVADQQLDGEIRETGSWTDFVTEDLGTIRLAEAGQCQFSVVPVTKPRMAVMNLKAIELRPVDE
jgi:alpha-L-fucosidase